MSARKPLSTAVLLTLLGVTLMALTRARAGGPDSPVGNVLWLLKDSVSACPAGDSVVAGHPSRLRIAVYYYDANDNNKVGVPPDSIWVTYSTGSGNTKVNDKSTNVYADDPTDANGMARITIPSLSGCGTLTVHLYVSGVSEGTKTAHIQTTDVDADRRTTPSDSTTGCDINWSGSVTQADRDAIGQHRNHWHRHALHGTMIKRTAQCDTCSSADAVNAYGSGEFSWSPDGRQISYTKHIQGPSDNPCKVYLIRSDPAGVSDRPFTYLSTPPKPDSSDYDPSWSPLGNEIIFGRFDRVIYRKGVPGSAADTSEIGVYSDDSTHFVESTTVSPDGDSIAFAREGGATEGSHLYTIPIGGGTRRQITSGLGVEDTYGHWSPDGKTLVFARLSSNQTWAYTARPADSNLTAVRHYTPNGFNVSVPSYSPDSLVVVCGRGNTDHTAYVTTTLEAADTTGSPVAITSNYPAFLNNNYFLSNLSPDGTRLGIVAKDPGVPGATLPQVWLARRNMSVPPRFTAIGSHAVADSSVTVTDSPTVGQNFTFTVSASDTDSDALTYDASFLQQGMTFTPSSRTFSWTPPTGTVGKTFHVKFVVKTASGGMDAIIDKMTVQGCCGLSKGPALEEAKAAVVTGQNPVYGRFTVTTPQVTGTPAELSVFDVTGRRIARVGGRSGSALTWDGRDADGVRVAPGLYLYRVEVGSLRQDGKLVLLR